MLPLGGISHFALLVLPCVVLGAVSSSADVQRHRIEQLGTADQHVQTALRGGLHISRAHHHHHGLAHLHAWGYQGSLLQAGAASGERRVRRKRSKLQRMLHSQKKMTRRTKMGRQMICRGMKLKWWIKIKKKCTKAYGSDSKWDRSRLDGKCGAAWSSCNTGFYAVCCTQPLGPKNLDAFCENQDMTATPAAEGEEGAKKDKACDAQKKVNEVRQVVDSIKRNIKLMDDAAVIIPPPPKPEITKSVVIMPAISAPSPGPMPGYAPAMPVAPAGIVEKKTVIMPPPPPPTPRPLESRCDKLAELTRQAMEKIHDVKHWAKGDGIHDDDDDDDQRSLDKDVKTANAENGEAKDPDLAFSVKNVLHIGKKLGSLLKMGDFCSKKRPVDDDDDDDDDDESIEADLKKDPSKDWGSDHHHEDEEEEDEDEPPVTEVNDTAVMGLLNWESDMAQAVEKFETEVHPHGYKWWRYRYEYTIVESLVLAFSVMVLYGVMWVLHGVSFFEAHKFYKTGLPQRFYRYAWGYLVFHGASLMVMVTCAYMLYVPWGKTNIFNMFADAFHEWIDGRANVPYMGYSWLYMILDVQFQLFVCFALYALFIVMVVNSYITALRDWKSLSEDQDAPCKNTLNGKTYRHFESIVRRRVDQHPEFKQIFKDLKLRLPGVQGLDSTLPGWHDFKLHVYLTDGLGKSAEYLVQVSLTTNIFLASSALIVAVLAHHYEVAFMYFLPGFVAVGFVIFVMGYAASKYFRKLSDTDDHKTHASVTVHAFCRSVQILLYCLFFSFARLLLSNDIFEFYKRVYLSALIGLLAILILLAIFAGEVIKETTCALILPPHLPAEVFRRRLEHMVNWHTQERCYECGVEQPNVQASFSKEWAGKKPVGDRPKSVGESFRQYSWRG